MTWNIAVREMSVLAYLKMIGDLQRRVTSLEDESRSVNELRAPHDLKQVLQFLGSRLLINLHQVAMMIANR